MMPSENRKKSFYFEVSKKSIVLIEVCVCPDNHSTKKTEKFKWFSDFHLLKLLEKLKDICLSRVLSANNTSEQVVQEVNEIISGPSSYFHIKYTFKKRGIKQFLVMQSLKKNRNKEFDDKCKYSGGGHREFYLFPERLKVFVSLAPLKSDTIIKDKVSVSKGTLGGKVAKQGTKTSIKEKSKYFSKDKDSSLTSSAVKKQANLRSIVQKMKGSDVDKDDAKTSIIQEQNDLSNSDLKREEVSKCNPCGTKDLILSDADYTRKRSRQDAGYSEDTTTESDTGADKIINPKDFDYDERDFITRKPLSRKKKLKHSDKQDKVQKPMELQKKERKNKPLSKTDANLVHTSTAIDTDSNCNTDMKECELSFEGSPGNDKGPSTGFVDLSEYNGSNHSVVVRKSLQEEDNKQLEMTENIEGRQYETITIDDTAPNFDNVKKIADLEKNHISFLIQKLQKRLKSIFMGKEYCRRHEDYKRGGRSKGDLAFQVRFGLYSEEQQEAIMKELMCIFCSRHNKYLDYLTKVLLPEAFILIYIELFGGNHDKVERILMGCEKKKEISQTDGSSTE